MKRSFQNISATFLIPIQRHIIKCDSGKEAYLFQFCILQMIWMMIQIVEKTPTTTATQSLTSDR
ncbi:MAG: hypothetical protein GDA51_05460 [Ekhidna sp.]|nr:hypothetical protein [Ekhidna sp.]